MSKPHIKKIAMGSLIFQCVSNHISHGCISTPVQGLGLSPIQAFDSWSLMLNYLTAKYPQDFGAIDDVSI